jgi:hypothetical protein
MPYAICHTIYLSFNQILLLHYCLLIPLQVVPPALLDFSAGVLRERFSAGMSMCMCMCMCMCMSMCVYILLPFNVLIKSYTCSTHKILYTHTHTHIHTHRHKEARFHFQLRQIQRSNPSPPVQTPDSTDHARSSSVHALIYQVLHAQVPRDLPQPLQVTPVYVFYVF